MCRELAGGHAGLQVRDRGFVQFERPDRERRHRSARPLAGAREGRQYYGACPKHARLEESPPGWLLRIGRQALLGSHGISPWSALIARQGIIGDRSRPPRSVSFLRGVQRFSKLET